MIVTIAITIATTKNTNLKKAEEITLNLFVGGRLFQDGI